MSVQLDLSSLPSSSQLDVHIHIAAPLRVTSTEARRRVTRLVISEIGNLLYGGEPTLLVGERILWRVPVVLSYPDRGFVGEAGSLDVDVETGAVLASTEQLTNIADYALFLAQRTAPDTA
jgi:hypothetical protein